ncbi:hypothetical protein O181_018635 [Austropuccinia psidii MF-1]|uniref:Uncharacterized protein n=1 Tax=Austropuccinia psidii MF-1 TaxID=1389203 RepID=A0A9Q3CA77_9BASI|nr:hypothetical protein [Austropuccinia psidii MF-1]
MTNSLKPPNRVKLRTQPPLSPLQAWITFEPSEDILSLKSSILPLLNKNQSAQVSSQDIFLELDGFAFLDESPCSVIDPSHDLIDVKLVASSTPTPATNLSKKRPRSLSKPPTTANDVHPSPLKPDSPGFQRCTSHPAKSLTSNGRSIKPLPSCRTNDNFPQAGPIIQKTPAPPGQGKAATKARNRRKKLKKMYERQEQKATDASHLTKNLQETNLLSAEKVQFTNLPSEVKDQPISEVQGADNKLKQPSLTVKQQPCRSPKSRSDFYQRIFSQDNPEDTSQESSSEDSESLSSEVTSSEEDSKSAGTSEETSSEQDSKQTESSEETESDSEGSQSDSLNSDSSAPSSAPIRESTQSVCALPSFTAIVQKTIPIAHDPQLNMLSFSNKNKRKNLKRSSHLANGTRPSKIVFQSSVPHQPRCPSPSFMPPSPTILPQNQTPQSQHLNLGQADDGLVTESFEQTFSGDTTTQSMTNPSYGNPPSQRSPSLIPSNVIITSIDVLDSGWVAGQIGSQSGTSSQLTNSVPSISKRTLKNRQKRLKRRQRAQSKRYDEGLFDDIEAAYAEFIGSGGHRKTPEEDVMTEHGNNETDQLKLINERWQDLEKIDQKSATIGERVAIRVIEISLETFTPESATYYGTLLATDDTHLALKLDPACLPLVPSTNNFLENELEEQAEGDEEEGNYDAKGAIRAHQRDALLQHFWGETPEVRKWEWSPSIDVRRL